MKYSDKLKERYAAEIRAWPLWKYIANGDLGYTYGNECGTVIGSHWIGTTTGVMPSGKIYMPWTTNQTMKDVIKDTAFSEALEKVCDDNGSFADWGNDSLNICQCLDEVYDSYLSQDGGNTWRHENKDFTTAEAIANMEAEGVFPGAYLCNERDGELNSVSLTEYLED